MKSKEICICALALLVIFGGCWNALRLIKKMGVQISNEKTERLQTITPDANGVVVVSLGSDEISQWLKFHPDYYIVEVKPISDSLQVLITAKKK